MSMVVIYGGLKTVKGMKPVLTITTAKHAKLAKKTAKDRADKYFLNVVSVTDKDQIKKLKSLKVKDGYQDKGDGFLMIPFTGADKLVKVYKLLKEEDKDYEHKNTVKAFKAAKAFIEEKAA